MDFSTLARVLLEHDLPHSDAFRDGLIGVLRNRVDGTPAISPFAYGSAETDAFYAGCMRGANEFRNALIEANGDRSAAIDYLAQLANTEGRTV